MPLTHIAFQGVEPSRPLQRRAVETSSVRPLAPLPGRRIEVSAEHIDSFAARILAASGIAPDAYRAKPIQRRLAACLRELRVADIADAQQLLEQSPRLAAPILETLLIGVTSFFRDTAVFQALRGTILPDLLRTRAGLNVYSAGASGGHELYSVAMLLDELGALETSTFLGIDCRAKAIAQAREGRFDRVDVESLTSEQRARYFSCDGELAIAENRLRARLQWRCMNLLAHEGEAASTDLILFRNVAIYLAPETAAQAYAQFARQLSPGGILVTGKAETPPRSLPLARVTHCIFRRL